METRNEGGVMDIQQKQAIWFKERPLFEVEFIHSHLLPYFNFNENTGDYEIKSESVHATDDGDRKVAYEALNTGWVMWLRAKREAKTQDVPEGFVLAHKELPEHIAESMALERVETPSYESDPTWAKISEDAYKGRLHSKKWELWRDYKEMIKAQE